MGRIVKDYRPDSYVVTGSLEGITPGRRRVKHLELRKVTDGSRGLENLPLFEELEDLQLDDVSGVDLAPLERVANLRRLSLFDVSPVVLERLRLPSTLESLVVANDNQRHPGEHVARVFDAIDWPRLGGLRRLMVTVGYASFPAVQVDLGVLAELPNLEVLRMEEGIRHSGARPSPLEPPFAGLSRRLHFVRIQAPDPDARREALERHLDIQHDPTRRQEGVVVYGLGPDVVDPPWTIGADDDGWSAYGRLIELSPTAETEHEAADEAERRVAATDPDLARRLDFDSEADGTGIAAQRREDLEAGLALLGITQGP